MTHIGLNAHLLSGTAGYRSAGIHGYIFHVLANLKAAAPPDWRFTALVGPSNSAAFDGLDLRRSRWDTGHPLRRLLWEQLAQPWHLGDFDLVHALAFVSPLILLRPSVVTVYDLSFIRFPQVLPASRRLYLRLFTQLSCQRARRVIAISQSTARDLTATFGIPPGRIDIALPGYDTRAYRPLPSEQIRAFRAAKDLPDRFWLFVGTLEPRKNLPMLLRAYAALPPAARLPLILAGGKGWDYQPIFDAVSQLDLEGQVRFPGYVPVEDLPLWYNSAQAFVYPSVYEGFGLPVLEAMACGTPVIVSGVSSLPEVAGTAGLCLPPDDEPAWTAALARAAVDDHWRQAARERGLQQAGQFDWSRTAGCTVASYRQALMG